MIYMDDHQGHPPGINLSYQPVSLCSNRPIRPADEIYNAKGLAVVF